MKKRKKKERIIPMPTEEDKMRARLKAAGSDPLVWAMKSVDDEFPDAREKSTETIEAEAEIDEIEEPETEEIEAEETEAAKVAKTVKTEDAEVKKVEAKNIEAKNPEESVEPKVVAPANENTATRTQVKLMSLESKQKKMMLGFAVLVLLAIGGVTFGVVAMVRQNQTTSALEEQIANVEAKDEDGISGDYIVLKDWGVKIKIAMGLTNITYNMQNNDLAEVMIWGVKQNSSRLGVPDFAKQTKNSNPLGTVVRVPRYERAAAGRLIWYDDYYNYYYQGPSGVPTISEEEMSWWVESYLLIKDMLTNADNYEAISENTTSE